MRLEFLRFLINDRICVFRNTHMFGYIILDFSGKYYFNRKPYVYIYWYNTKSSFTEIVLKAYLLPLFREKWCLLFSNVNFTYKHGIFDYMLPIVIFFHLLTSSVVYFIHLIFLIIRQSFQNRSSILLWDIYPNKIKYSSFCLQY